MELNDKQKESLLKEAAAYLMEKYQMTFWNI